MTDNYNDDYREVIPEEEVTDIKEEIQGSNVEVIYSTFDELPDHPDHS